MRAERSARREQPGAVRLRVERAGPSGQLVFEADAIAKSYGDKRIVGGFSMRVLRGDRIGLIGPNGAGKTTLLRLLLGELTPDEGEVRRGANVEVTYYDQQREQLDPDRTVVDTIGDGNDTVTVNGQPRHVHGYLQDFLFSPERARSPVHALSGGERNRLLLARLFTRPANVLVLDEPTNDLDLETLELLEEQLVEWPGTLLLVSHDRVFLDNVVTSTFAFEGDGRVVENVGGYADWLRQTSSETRTRRRTEDQEERVTASPAASRSAQPRRLSYNEQRELEQLPAQIEALESEHRTLSARIAGPEFYKESAETIHETLARIDAIQHQLTAAYTSWDELETRAIRN